MYYRENPSQNTVWLQNPETGEFEWNEDLHELFNLSIDEKRKPLRSHTHFGAFTGADGLYRWEDGQLILCRVLYADYADALYEVFLPYLDLDYKG